MAVLMPRDLLEEAVRGNSAALFAIVGGLLVISLIGCVLISKRYLRPIHQGLSSIRDRAFETETGDFGVVEIDALFAELAEEIRSHREEVSRLRMEYEKAQARVERLADKKQQEIDPEEFASFLANLKRRTVTERRIFDLYLEGKTPKEIMELAQIKENILKYHNRNIYGKLGMANRKQLLQFATLMEQRDKERGNGMPQ